MTNKQLLATIRKELNAQKEQAYKEGATNFFKEKINPIGVRTPKVRKIANRYFKEVKALSKKELFAVCELLLEKKTFEETTIAFAWLRKREEELVPADFARLERWLKKYVTNWAFCDDFCTHPFGYLIWKYPELIKKTVKWRTSKNRWLRRASAVIFIHPMWTKNRPVVKQSYLKDVFATAETLLHDEDDLVQKGYGWMLKAAAYKFPGDVYDFVLKHKETMPRTALRYAIEKFPQEMRKVAMRKSG